MKIIRRIKEIIFWLFILIYIFGIRSVIGEGLQKALDVLIVIAIVCSLLVLWLKNRQA
ncbi:hypothetical protein SC09_contig10orf00023 [Bacillus subtilis]|uniref:Uncharacterized protein n=1 Tax=Bacillus subtilis TaxID=1423 RepID=A0A0D1KM21_BACIU|nr:hypothetical protein SC09_contig10orf00023 [Bacillus subtilis]